MKCLIITMNIQTAETFNFIIATEYLNRNTFQHSGGREINKVLSEAEIKGIQISDIPLEVYDGLEGDGLLKYEREPWSVLQESY